jgi:hypothetical protein
VPRSRVFERRPDAPRSLLVTALAVAALGFLCAGCGGGGSGAPAAPPAAPPPPGPLTKAGIAAQVARVVRICQFATSDNQKLDCYTQRLLRIVDEEGHPDRVLPRIDVAVRRVDDGYLRDGCHLIMHGVGRLWGAQHHVGLGDLQRFLPRSNDPGCSAGFAHGLLTSVGPDLFAEGGRAALASCQRAATRYQRYSCVHGLGHAYMRLYAEKLPLALHACGALGPLGVDCAQGAFHDYWFALKGLDGILTRARPLTPQALCGHQPARFVRVCWYRASLENLPLRAVRTPRDLDAVCDRLAGLQRQSCVTGASLVSSADPFAQIALCARVRTGEQVSCARGIAVQVLAGRQTATSLRLVSRCRAFARANVLPCVAWLSEVLDVTSDGGFARRGCPLLPAGERAACRRGVRASAGPLETFS